MLFSRKQSLAIFIAAFLATPVLASPHLLLHRESGAAPAVEKENALGCEEPHCVGDDAVSMKDAVEQVRSHKGHIKREEQCVNYCNPKGQDPCCMVDANGMVTHFEVNPFLLAAQNADLNSEAPEAAGLVQRSALNEGFQPGNGHAKNPPCTGCDEDETEDGDLRREKRENGAGHGGDGPAPNCLGKGGTQGCEEWEH